MIIREKVRIGDQLVTLETGRIAKQAGGSVLVRAGDTIVLVTVCGNHDPKPGQSFFPLSVDYQEKTYAAGKIPGGFFKREGKLRDYEVLVSRLIDRPCRPLFPEGWLSEVQIVATVMSFDHENPPDTLAMIGASAALHVSQIPWKGPIAGVRVGRIDGKFIANPTFEQIEQSDCELLVAASRDAIVMVEGEADEMSEEDLTEALFFAHNAVQDTLDLIDRMQQAVGKTKWRFSEATTPSSIKERMLKVAGYKTREACNIANKHARGDAFKQVRKEALEILGPEFPGQEEQLKAAFEELRYNTMRAQVLDEGRRLDGRDTRTVRPISIELGVLPRVHGSSLFTRGETQAIVTTTLGTSRDSQRLDTLMGDEHKHFMLHYNFPPYSVGEVKPMRGPGRREVGHGNLAERALAKMMPSKEEFPYAVRIVSEITESNGSSSMASVCGGSLALMDAGVPVKAPVAGVAMGLIKEGEDYAVLTDILGDEDALGDMDFKVCGTDKGVTAIQMDIKIEGLSREILERALHQAREARLHILDKMLRSISAPRAELSQYAPRITSIKVKPDQVRTIIGPGGKMIRAIVDQTGASIDVEDDGTVNVASADSASVLKALEIIKSLTTEPEIGEVYEGTVKRIEAYGAFIEILPGKDGLCHISDMDWTHVNSVEDIVNLGDKVTVKVTNIDREGRIRLSRKDAMSEQLQAAGKANGRSSEVRLDDKPRDRRPGREERPAREERPLRLDRAPREEREERPLRAEPALREDRPARAPREEREERPVRAEPALREERPVRPLREEREERPLRAEPVLREERAARLGREERPLRAEPALREERAVRPPREERLARPAREELRDDRPARAAREDGPAREERPLRGVRDELRDERPLRADRAVRDELPAREERPVRSERPAREERDERSASRERGLREERFAKPRDLEERPVKTRDFERDERPAKVRDVERDERFAKPRDLERDVKPRDEFRSVVKPRERDLERDVRTPSKPVDRDEAPIARVREDRPPAARRDEPRKERVAEERLDRPERARVRDDEREVRPRVRDELREERPAARTRDDQRDVARERPARDLDRDVRPASRTRDVEELERPARRRDFDAPPRGRDFDAPRGRDAERLEPARGRGDVERLDPVRSREERPAARGRDDELPRRREEGRALSEREPRADERGPRARQGGRDERVETRARDDERSRLRDSDLPVRPARRAGTEDDRLFDEEPVEAGASRERGDRTERERPSRTRERARNRERARELDRERR